MSALDQRRHFGHNDRLVAPDHDDAACARHTCEPCCADMRGVAEIIQREYREQDARRAAKEIQ